MPELFIPADTAMARLPRLIAPHQPHHVIQRSVDGVAAFRDDADYAAFLGWLHEAAKRFKVAIHAYALLPERINLLLTPSDKVGLGKMMQWAGRQYVPYFNARYRRSGALWQGRFRATVLDAPRHFMTCSCYIDLCPAYEAQAAVPEAYRWSSYAHHAGVKADPMLTDHALYWSLGNTPFEREAAYRRLAEQGVSQAEIEALNSATLKGWAHGSEKFKSELESKVKRRVSPARRGRPAKAGRQQA